jgi:hypothetical protein
LSDLGGGSFGSRRAGQRFALLGSAFSEPLPKPRTDARGSEAERSEHFGQVLDE